MANLTSLKVKNARPGTYGDGKGLYLRVKPSGSRSWILRVQHQGRRQDIGLGSVDDVSLAEARDSASRLRRIARLGNDAIAERDRGKIRVVTFQEAARSEEHTSELQSLMRISYAVFCLKKKKKQQAS